MRLKNVVVPIIIINIVMFLIQIVVSGFTDAFVLVGADVLSRPWILLTSMFLHGSVNHLVFNMYALFMFGPLVEQRIGSKRFLYIYFLSGLLAAVGAAFFYESALGASGAIMGILGVTIMLMPDLPVLLFFFIPMSLRTAGIIFAMIDIFGIFVPSGIANIAHLVGLACGLAYGYYLLKKKSTFTKRFVRQPIVVSSTDLSEEDMDDYLKYGRI